MKKLYTLILLIININIYAQMGGGYYNPDSLEIVTIKGYAVVDSNFVTAQFYLDETNDGVADYRLNFGPDWYYPENSNAVRPADGELISVTGGLADTTTSSLPTVIVYEINDEFWRNPYDPYWNHMGNMGGGGHFMDSCFNSGFGWQHDPPVPIRAVGRIFTDTTIINAHYYIDINTDNRPDYILNFGPPWYDPVSLAHRPADGDQVDITGGYFDNDVYPVIVVYTLNGQIWRDSTYFNGSIGGGWIHKDMDQMVRFHTPFDESDWMEVNPGWHNSGSGHHGAMQDSLFCQILETLPGTMNMLGNENAFAGYEVNFFVQGMMGGGMQSGMGCGGHMQFNNTVNFQFHYTDAQINSYNISEQTIQIKYWDSDVNEWAVITTTDLDTSANTVSFADGTVSNFYIITGSSPTGADDEPGIINTFSLEQNYPNPFNPSTVIKWQIPDAGHSEIKIFDLIGREITTLVSEYRQAGEFETEFNAVNLPSGVYFYRLKSGMNVMMKKMILMK